MRVAPVYDEDVHRLATRNRESAARSGHIYALRNKTLMQLLPHQKHSSALRHLVCEALELLTSGQLELLVERYGYAMAFKRNPVCAVKADLAEALQEAAGSALLTVASNELLVVYCQDNDTGLRAAIDCAVPSLGGRCVLISFVVAGSETEQFLTLEDISAEPSGTVDADWCE